MFFDTFYELCKKKGVSCKKAVLEMGLSNSIATKWRKTAATPTGETLQRIAQYFDVSIDYLLSYDPNLEKSDELISLYYKSVLSWSTNKFISKTNQKNVKGHFAELLLRYKLFLEALSHHDRDRIEAEIQNLEAWISAARSFAIAEEDCENPSMCLHGITYSEDISEDE